MDRSKQNQLFKSLAFTISNSLYHNSRQRLRLSPMSITEWVCCNLFLVILGCLKFVLVIRCAFSGISLICFLNLCQKCFLSVFVCSIILFLVFLTAIWLSRGQFWAILEGIVSVTRCQLLHFDDFDPKVTVSLARRQGA